MRSQCPAGHWFQDLGPCPYDDCGYVPPEPEPTPPPTRESYDRPIANPDRDALAVAPRERIEGHQRGISLVRKALEEAKYRKQHPQRMEAIR